MSRKGHVLRWRPKVYCTSVRTAHVGAYETVLIIFLLILQIITTAQMTMPIGGVGEKPLRKWDLQQDFHWSNVLRNMHKEQYWSTKAMNSKSLKSCLIQHHKQILNSTVTAGTTHFMCCFGIRNNDNSPHTHWWQPFQALRQSKNELVCIISNHSIIQGCILFRNFFNHCKIARTT